MIFAHLTLPAE